MTINLEKLRRRFHRKLLEKWVCILCGYTTVTPKQKCPKCGAVMEYRVVIR